VASVVEVSGELAGCFDAGGAAAADDDAFGCGEFGVDGCESGDGVCVRPVEGERRLECAEEPVATTRAW
jgi:hypothetical protein